MTGGEPRGHSAGAGPVLCLDLGGENSPGWTLFWYVSPYNIYSTFPSSQHTSLFFP